MSEVCTSIRPEETFKERTMELRLKIKDIAKQLSFFKLYIGTEETKDGEDKGEMMANLTLTYRHLEDASMRLGKAIQASDGGISVYDNSAVGLTGKSEIINK